MDKSMANGMNSTRMEPRLMHPLLDLVSIFVVRLSIYRNGKLKLDPTMQA